MAVEQCGLQERWASWKSRNQVISLFLCISARGDISFLLISDRTQDNGPLPLPWGENERTGFGFMLLLNLVLPPLSERKKTDITNLALRCSLVKTLFVPLGASVQSKSPWHAQRFQQEEDVQ